MKQLTDKITFRSGATINNRIVQTPMLTNSGIHEEAPPLILVDFAAFSCEPPDQDSR